VAKKYTRKQLKRPDEFISFSMKAWTFVQERIPFFLLSLAVAAVIIGALWLWTYFSSSSAMKTTAMITRAIEINNQTILPGSEKLPADEDGIPRFKSRAEKLKAVEEELGKAAKGGGSVGTIALVMRGGILYDEGKYREAITDYQKFLQQSDDKRFRSLAIEGLGYCYEALKDWDKALDQFKKLPVEGDQRFFAMYHQARVLAQKGQAQEAAALYKQIIAKGGLGSLADRASDRLAMIETK
jgi:tetratricopeptide (TPR) repeat protein